MTRIEEIRQRACNLDFRHEEIFWLCKHAAELEQQLAALRGASEKCRVVLQSGTLVVSGWKSRHTEAIDAVQSALAATAGGEGGGEG